MRNKYLKFLMIILIVEIIIFIITSVFWWNPLSWHWNIFNLFSKPQTSTTKPNQKITDQTADWKTYIYNKYGFQISYPSDWKFGISSTYEEGEACFISPKDSQGNDMSFCVQRYNLNEGGFGYPSETSTATNMSVDGIKAYKDEGFVRNPNGPSTQGIWLIKDKFVYWLNFQVFKKFNLPSQYKYEDIKPAIFTSEEKEIMNKFVSTFKFIK